MANYATWVADLANQTATDTTDPNFQQILPACIADAEGRCYRDLDIFVANVRDGSASCTASNRNFNLPTTVGTFIIVEGMNIITPTATAPDSGTRNPVQFVSRDFVDAIYPTATTATGVPRYAAWVTNNTYLSGGAAQSQIILGPAPDQSYRVEVIGRITPPPLSSTNTNTFLTDWLYDLFLAASMVFMSGYMRNFGAQADNPQMATSWDGQYKERLLSAQVYEARKRWSGASWSAKQPEATAVPQRG